MCAKWEGFINHWTVFLCAANSLVGSPVLYQHLTDLAFKLLYLKDSIAANNTENAGVGPLTYNEVNALRYAAGYVCRDIRKKIEASHHPLKEEMTLCQMTIYGEGEI